MSIGCCKIMRWNVSALTLCIVCAMAFELSAQNNDEDDSSSRPRLPKEQDIWGDSSNGGTRTGNESAAGDAASSTPGRADTPSGIDNADASSEAGSNGRDVFSGSGQPSVSDESFDAKAVARKLKPAYSIHRLREFGLGAMLWSGTLALEGESITDDMITMGYAATHVDFINKFNLSAEDLSVMPTIAVRWGRSNTFILSGFSFGFDGEAQLAPGMAFGDYLWEDNVGNPAYVTVSTTFEEIRLMFYKEFGTKMVKVGYGVGFDVFHWNTIVQTADTVMTPATDLSTMVTEAGVFDKEDYWLPLPTFGFRTEAIVGYGITAFADVEGTWLGVGYTFDYRAGLTYTPLFWSYTRLETGYRGFIIHADGAFNSRNVLGDLDLSGPYASMIFIF